MGEGEYYNGVEPVEVGDMSGIKRENPVMPATKGVKVEIVNTENRINEANTYRWIRLQLRVVDGIQIPNDVSGEVETKYKGMSIFTNACYFVDMVNGVSTNTGKKYSEINMFKKKQHLLNLKNLSEATGIDLTLVDGHRIEELKGMTVKADITTSTNKKTGEINNEARNFKVVPLEDSV